MMAATAVVVCGARVVAALDAVVIDSPPPGHVSGFRTTLQRPNEVNFNLERRSLRRAFECRPRLSWQSADLACYAATDVNFVLVATPA